ncbi:MAG: CoA ester lyase [Pseudomonadota bacterium]
MNNDYHPRRTMLYVPAHNPRNIEKSRLLPTDSIIFDLQESVPPSEKANARKVLKEAFAQSADFGHSERVLRVNPLGSKWNNDDIALIQELEIDAVMFPSIESKAQILQAIEEIDFNAKKKLDLMINIETPLGVLKAEEIAGASDRISCIVLGTTDLGNELKIGPAPDRLGLLTSLSLVILAARAHKRCVVDGPHLELKDIQTCEFSCRQARDLGFDGKAVIHPVQLKYTNDAFTPKRDDVNRAQRIIAAINEAQSKGKSSAVLDDRLIEPGLEEWANRIISLYDKVHEIGQSDLVGAE